MTRELARKAIHLATVSAALLVWLLPQPAAALLLGSAAVLALAVELLRWRVRWVRYHFLRRTRTMLRHHERRGLAGATYMAVGYALAAAFFPREVAVAAILYNGLGDAAAALVGKRYGRHRTRWGKSWEGAAAAAAVCLGVGALVPGIPAVAAVAGGVGAALLEFLPLPLDDNLRITLGGGALLWLVVLLV